MQLYPKEKTVYSEDGEVISKETVYTKGSEDNVKLIIYYPPYEEGRSFNQKEETFDLSDFAYDNAEDYFDIDLIDHYMEPESIRIIEASNSFQEESKQQLQIFKAIENEQPIEKIIIGDYLVIKSTCFGFKSALLALVETISLKFMGTGEKFSIKNDVEQIKKLKRELKNKN